MKTGKINAKGANWIVLANNILEKIDLDQVKELIGILKENFGSRELNEDIRNDLSEKLGVDPTTANAWKKVDDVLNYLDLAELAKRNPDASKTAATIILSIIGCFFPVVLTAAGAVAAIPSELAGKIIQYGGMVAPEHLLHLAIRKLAQNKPLKADENGEIIIAEEDVDDGRLPLVVVYKDEIIADQLQSLLNENKDLHVVLYNEKAWNARQEERTYNGKILFLGEIKNNDALKNLIDAKFNTYGVIYGWTGNRALIFADLKEVADKQAYLALLKELQELPVPEKFKTDLKQKLNAEFAAKALLVTPWLIKDHFDERTAVRRQQLFYGIYKFCQNDLADFLRE